MIIERVSIDTWMYLRTGNYNESIAPKCVYNNFLLKRPTILVMEEPTPQAGLRCHGILGMHTIQNLPQNRCNLKNICTAFRTKKKSMYTCNIAKIFIQDLI
jgi:hypothetical protein